MPKSSRFYSLSKEGRDNYTYKYNQKLGKYKKQSKYLRHRKPGVHWKTRLAVEPQTTNKVENDQRLYYRRKLFYILTHTQYLSAAEKKRAVDAQAKLNYVRTLTPTHLGRLHRLVAASIAKIQWSVGHANRLKQQDIRRHTRHRQSEDNYNRWRDNKRDRASRQEAADWRGFQAQQRAEKKAKGPNNYLHLGSAGGVDVSYFVDKKTGAIKIVEIPNVSAPVHIQEQALQHVQNEDPLAGLLNLAHNAETVPYDDSGDNMKTRPRSGNSLRPPPSKRSRTLDSDAHDSWHEPEYREDTRDDYVRKLKEEQPPWSYPLTNLF